MLKTIRNLIVLFNFALSAGYMLSATAATNQTDTLKVCLYPGFPPFAEKSSDGIWTGWDVEYLQSFASYINKRFVPVEIANFNQIWMGPVHDLCDIAATGISDIPARRIESGKGSAWTQHYYQVVRAFLVKESDSQNFKNLHSLFGKKIIVTQNSTAHMDIVNRLSPEFLDHVKIEFTTDEQAAALLVKNSAGQDAPFAYAGGLGSLEYLASKFDAMAVVWPHCFMNANKKEEAEPFSFVVRADSPVLIKQLNTFISENLSPYPGGRGANFACSAK